MQIEINNQIKLNIKVCNKQILEDCSICLESIDQECYKLYCSHHFHIKCLNQWISYHKSKYKMDIDFLIENAIDLDFITEDLDIPSNATCPLCRSKIFCHS